MKLWPLPFSFLRVALGLIIESTILLLPLVRVALRHCAPVVVYLVTLSSKLTEDWRFESPDKAALFLVFVVFFRRENAWWACVVRKLY